MLFPNFPTFYIIILILQYDNYYITDCSNKSDNVHFVNVIYKFWQSFFDKLFLIPLEDRKLYIKVWTVLILNSP